MPVLVTAAGPDDHALIAQAYAEVFRPSFDTNELPGIDGITPCASRIVLVAVEGTTLVGGAVSDTFGSRDVGLLSYMASRPGQRSRGVGAHLLDALRQRWSSDGTDLVVAEVRDPRMWATTERERPIDRLRFYDRNGCYLVPVPWVQPNVGSHEREAGLLLLAAHGVALGDRIPGALLAAWTARYYIDSEGAEPEDAQYRALVETMAHGDLEVLPVDAYVDVPLLDR